MKVNLLQQRRCATFQKGPRVCPRVWKIGYKAHPSRDRLLQPGVRFRATLKDQRAGSSDARCAHQETRRKVGGGKIRLGRTRQCFSAGARSSLLAQQRRRLAQARLTFPGSDLQSQLAPRESPQSMRCENKHHRRTTPQNWGDIKN